MSNRRSFLDEIDNQILQILQENARIQLRALAAKLGISTSTLHYRINRLEEEKIIKGYHADVALVPSEEEFQVLLNIAILPENLILFKEFLQNLKHVKDVYQVAGFFNMILLVKTQQHSLFIEEVYNPIVNSKLIQEIQVNIVIHSNRKN